MFKKSLFIIFILLTSFLLSTSVLSGDSKKCHIKDGTMVFFISGTNLSSSYVIGRTKVTIVRDLSTDEVKNLNGLTGVDFTGAKSLTAEKITIFCVFHGSHTYENMNIVIPIEDLICESINLWESENII